MSPRSRPVRGRIHAAVRRTTPRNYICRVSPGCSMARASLIRLQFLPHALLQTSPALRMLPCDAPPPRRLAGWRCPRRGCRSGGGRAHARRLEAHAARIEIRTHTVLSMLQQGVQARVLMYSLPHDMLLAMNLPGFRNGVGGRDECGAAIIVARLPKRWWRARRRSVLWRHSTRQSAHRGPLVKEDGPRDGRGDCLARGFVVALKCAAWIPHRSRKFAAHPWQLDALAAHPWRYDFNARVQLRPGHGGDGRDEKGEEMEGRTRQESPSATLCAIHVIGTVTDA